MANKQRTSTEDPRPSVQAPYNFCSQNIGHVKSFGPVLSSELREALLKNGLPSFRDGGMVTASEHLLAGRQF